MGALPKRKYAKARQGKRRSHLHLTAPSLVSCPRCRSLKLAHHVCPTCGTYAGRQVVKVKGPKQAEK
ncbi:MAG: 50S ribosomal protein L32 [Dehalococcoidia bacterium]|nr:50S ribosomal protein L32 [Dehalococcoidia bacterium]